MQITLLGTGCPAVCTHRYGAGQVVSHNNKNVLIDCGSGITQRLIGCGLSGADIDVLLLTHLHSDHIIDFYQLVVSGWHQGREKPLTVYGPIGTKKFVNDTMKTWESERNERIAFEQRPSATGLDVVVVEYSDGFELAVGDMDISAVRVKHEPIEHAFGFVFNANGKKLVISGDTRKCDALIDASHNADVLVHEVYIHREMKPVDGIRSQQTIDATASYHTLSNEVGEVASLSNAKAMVLTHFVPPVFDKQELLMEVSQTYSGRIVIGEDLMTINIDNMTVSANGVEFKL